ncbi:MAG: adenosylcobinamide-GDP ribazoletransferase [Burkholderiaceae bacterium]|nr:adenosylcobinamide-GDP ribazoletransferase [Burkholderiaceae bacterium]
MDRYLQSGSALKAAALGQLRLFFIALQFFTRLPVPSWVGFQPEWLQQSARYYPLVGLVVGLTTSLVYLVAAWVLPQGVAVLLSISAGVYLTGAFHEDGFADVCDGIGGGYTPERIFQIMKDSRIGTYGTVGLGLLLAVKAMALFYMDAATVVGALWVGHSVSRLLSAALIWKLDYAKEEGKAKPLAQHMASREFAIAAATACLPLLVVGLLGLVSWSGMLVGIAAALIATVWLSRLFVRAIGGFTGDCLGAVQQASEVCFYLGVLCSFT